ncbi:uncharacterized protein ACIB01_008603 [Guaruba guarouba]
MAAPAAPGPVRSAPAPPRHCRAAPARGRRRAAGSQVRGSPGGGPGTVLRMLRPRRLERGIGTSARAGPRSGRMLRLQQRTGTGISAWIPASPARAGILQRRHRRFCPGTAAGLPPAPGLTLPSFSPPGTSTGSAPAPGLLFLHRPFPVCPSF